MQSDVMRGNEYQIVAQSLQRSAHLLCVALYTTDVLGKKPCIDENHLEHPADEGELAGATPCP
jgi:hypothetical protein